ncbi:DUF1761 domain-containing protein [Cryobacterium frigoriphilum]|uniref:DUF1761 domain-containing protein n=1 Tax=Cryobacterium frigoriphilum TaxID=1259150 RepID=A0A4R8ZYU0_9MICO|nr:DUF1761 domain-containing protein [Cryobacterium frigoriphilum]TFD49118.1 DUF1761 domain-containing protein [Cryobacterium frigoriphilum]
MDVSINWLAVLIAALSNFSIGALWYSTLFAKSWQREAGVTDEQLQTGAFRIFGAAFALAFVMAASLAAFIGDGGLGFGVFAGITTGTTFVAAAFGVNYLFERRSLTLFYINGSYSLVSFTVMGTIIGLLQ